MNGPLEYRCDLSFVDLGKLFSQNDKTIDNLCSKIRDHIESTKIDIHNLEALEYQMCLNNNLVKELDEFNLSFLKPAINLIDKLKEDLSFFDFSSSILCSKEYFKIMTLFELFLRFIKIRHDLLGLPITRILTGNKGLMNYDFKMYKIGSELKRSIDHMFYNPENKTLYLIEFTYSHNDYKGFISKGSSIITSKYLPEISKIIESDHNSLIKEVVYIPIIVSQLWYESISPFSTDETILDLLKTNKFLKKYIQLSEEVGLTPTNIAELSENSPDFRLFKMGIIFSVNIKICCYKYGSFFNNLLSVYNFYTSYRHSLKPTVEYNSEIVNNFALTKFKVDNEYEIKFLHQLFGCLYKVDDLDMDKVIDDILTYKITYICESMDDVELISFTTYGKLLRNLKVLKENGVLNNSNFMILIKPMSFIKNEFISSFQSTYIYNLKKQFIINVYSNIKVKFQNDNLSEIDHVDCDSQFDLLRDSKIKTLSIIKYYITKDQHTEIIKDLSSIRYIPENLEDVVKVNASEYLIQDTTEALKSISDLFSVYKRYVNDTIKKYKELIYRKSLSKFPEKLKAQMEKLEKYNFSEPSFDVNSMNLIPFIMFNKGNIKNIQQTMMDSLINKLSRNIEIHLIRVDTFDLIKVIMHECMAVPNPSNKSVNLKITMPFLYYMINEVTKDLETKISEFVKKTEKSLKT